MQQSLLNKLILTLKQAEQHNSNIMVKPEVILWPDPERQWETIIPVLQQHMPALLVYGVYDKNKRQGPSIWLKCMVVRSLPEANWEASITPIIYLPGISKNQLRNVQSARLDFQPLLEYQYTGTILTQENGKEWTVQAFLQNSQQGMGLKVSADTATKDALKKALSFIVRENVSLYEQTVIDASYLHKQLFPNIVTAVLKWMCKGDTYSNTMEKGKQEVFRALCKSVYNFEPDVKNIKAIAEMLGNRRGAWKDVWHHYANAPLKYPEIKELLRLAKPNDLFLAAPEDSWPQVNEEREDTLRKEIVAIAEHDVREAVKQLKALVAIHAIRNQWVWAELGDAPLAAAMPWLSEMASLTEIPVSATSIDDLRSYYIEKGVKIDQAMRKAIYYARSEKDKKAINGIIQLIYKPWIAQVTEKFQSLVKAEPSIFTSQKAEQETSQFVLFVDALRYELAEEFCTRLLSQQYKVSLTNSWSAIPSLTPTAKNSIAPIADKIAVNSLCNEFRPQLTNGKDLQTAVFRDSLIEYGFTYLSSSADITSGQKYWQEIGDIDTKGHEEQANMVRRIDELFETVQEAIDIAFESGITKIKIVTDHGWLLLPGGLPKEELKKGLAETRWGRCALIKDGAKTDLLNLPWRWNPLVHIAYAPGIAFFKKNEEYAHGGISIHECLVPVINIESKTKVVASKITEVKWVNLKCTVSTSDVSHGYKVDIRTKYNDSKTSIVLSANKAIKDNKCTLMVDDAAEGGAATIVLLDENDIILDKKLTHVGS
jgi:hypothetical protein